MLFRKIRTFLISLRKATFERVYDFGFGFDIEDGNWRASFVEILAPLPGEQVLEVTGTGLTWGFLLARQFPETRFVIADKDQKAPSKNNATLGQELVGRLCCRSCAFACNGGVFDKVICSFVLHSLQSEEKLRLLQEMRRVLRRGGTLYIADYDRPQTSLERTGLAYASRKHGRAATLAHFNGTWIDIVTRAGFTELRRMSTFAETTGRVALFRARRPR